MQVYLVYDVGVTGDIGECSSNHSLYSDPSVVRCPEKSWLALVLFAVYMIMSNVLLLNLLIAMFRYVFNDILTNLMREREEV